MQCTNTRPLITATSESERVDQTPDVDRFEYIDNEKRFIGPFGIHMHSPAVGEAFLNFAKALRTLNVPPELRECAILGVGARTKAAYEIAAHRQVSGFRQFELDQMDQGKIPDSFSPQQKAAFNLALELGKPGPLDRTSYDGFVKVSSSVLPGVHTVSGSRGGQCSSDHTSCWLLWLCLCCPQWIRRQSPVAKMNGFCPYDGRSRAPGEGSLELNTNASELIRGSAISHHVLVVLT